MGYHYEELSNREYVSAAQHHEMLLSLLVQVKKDSYSPDLIIGPERGAFSEIRPTLSIFHNAKYDTLRVTHYETASGVKLPKPKIDVPLRHPELVENSNVLVIDDCVDDGSTAEFLHTELLKLKPKDLRFAVLFYKHLSKFMPHYWVTRTSKWMIFFYELQEDARGLMQGRGISRSPLTLEEVLEFYRGLNVPEYELENLQHLL